MIGDVIRRERERRGWSQRDFADRAGLSQTYVSLLEKGERDNVGSDKLQAIARVLDLTTDEVLRLATQPLEFPAEALTAAGLPENEIRRYQRLWLANPDKRRALVESAYRLAQEYKYLADIAADAHQPNGANGQAPGHLHSA